MQLLVQPDGIMRCVYGEEIDLSTIGSLTIRRGSHVEPDEDGRWFADLAPSRGPRLGPYVCRSDALDAERRWLSENWLVRVPDDSHQGTILLSPMQMSSWEPICDPVADQRRNPRVRP